MLSVNNTANIVSIQEYKIVEKADEIGWDIFIRMELLESFKEYKGNRKLSEEEVIKLGQDVCSALEICKIKNIIHRDIKPENIFISEFNVFKVGDFGIARRLESRSNVNPLTAIGTPGYAAPEVISDNYDERVDIYSLGIVLYWLLNNNRHPFSGLNLQEKRDNSGTGLLQNEMIHLPPPSEASPEMAAVILKACHPNPNMRYKNATELKNALKAVGDGMLPPPNPPLPQPPLPHKPKMSKYRKVAIIAGFAFICWLIAGILILVLGDRNDSKQPPEQSSPTMSSPTPILTPDPSPNHEPTQSFNTVGNSQGNSINGGFAAIQGNKIFVNHVGSVYSINIDGSNKKTIINDGASYIFVIGDWIYYAGIDRGIFRERTDGSIKQLISNDIAWHINVVDEWIYYINVGDEYNDFRMYRTRTDGSDKQRLTDKRPVSFNVIDNWIYYTVTDDSGIFKIRTDGSDRLKLSDDEAHCIIVVGNWIYFNILNDGIYRIRIDGSDSQKLSGENTLFINATEDWIYFACLSDSGLYRIRTDGSNRQRLSDDSTLTVNIIDDWLIFRVWGFEDGEMILEPELYIMKTDGSERQLFDDWVRH
jgi:serine/threonine protein kinase